jgi:pyruvate dehydrogenase E2 component (dihydrolipoamide acetyltransferase)
MGMNPTRRKLAIATWSAPAEGNIYGKLTLDAGPALAYLEHLREKTGEKVTITHLVGKAVATALARSPGLNGFIRFDTYHEHKTVDLAFLVALEEGADLAKAKVRGLDGKSVAVLARELREKAQKLRDGKDEEFNKSKGPLRSLPTFGVRWLLRVVGWLTGSLGISAPSLGLEAFPFGAAVVTSVGMFGLDEGFVPPTPFARVPLYVLVGAVRERPAVVAGALTVRPQLTLTATLDHRFVDGAGGAVLAKTIRQVLEDPWSLGEPEADPEKRVALP